MPCVRDGFCQLLNADKILAYNIISYHTAAICYMQTAIKALFMTERVVGVYDGGARL